MKPSRHSKMKPHLHKLGWLGAALLLLAGLMAVQLTARWRYQTRGWPAAFPAPLADVALPRPACVNAALEQYPPETLPWALDTIAAGGFDLVRQRFDWAAIEPAPGDFHWEPWDALVREAQARDVYLLPVLDGAPAWAGRPPAPADFARFAQAVAHRYGDALTYYQIWHNPNLGDHWGGRADPFGYTALLAAAAESLRAADPDARILLGGLAPTVEVGADNFAEDLFLEMLVAAGAAPYFDVVAVQPYGLDNAPDDRRVSRDVLNFSRAVLVWEQLTALGLGDKSLWATHFGWNSQPAAWPGPASIWGDVTPETQAAYTLAALERAEREWPWMGALCLNGFQPRPETAAAPDNTPNAEEHWGFALVGPDGELRPLYAALQARRARPATATPGGHNAGTALAAFTGTWTRGPQGADIGQTGDRVSLPFTGTDIALTVRRGPYRAFLFVTVDGAPAPALPRDREGRSYVVLYDPLAAVATVPLAENLPPGPHTVEVIAERGWGQWALADWRIVHRPDARPYRRSLAVCVGLALLGAGLLVAGWRGMTESKLAQTARAAWRKLQHGGQIALTGALGALYLFAGWRLLLGEAVFRRLGEGGDLPALLLAAGLFYFSPWTLITLGAGALVSAIALLRPALGLLLVTLAVPFYMHPLSLVGKSFALAELVLLPTAVGAFLHWVNTRRNPSDAHPQKQPFRLPLLGFVLIALLTTLAAAHRHEALRELRLVILEPALYFLALTSLPLSRRERWRIVDAFVCSAVIVAVIGLLQYGASFCRGVGACDTIAQTLGGVITAEGGMRRLHSVYGSPNNVGLYLGRALPLTLAVLLWSSGDAVNLKAFFRELPRSPRRVAYALALLPISLALLLSLSRGALVLGLPLALLTLGLLAGPTWRKVTLGLLLVGLLALIPLLNTPRFAGLFDPTQGTTGFRVALWHSSAQLLREHPLLGVGPDNFLYAYRTRYVLPTAWEEFNLSHPHNVALDYLVRLGLPGLALGVWFQVLFWRRALPQRRHPQAEMRALALGAMGAMANFLGHGLVDAAYFVVDLAYVFFLLLAIVMWISRASPDPTKPPLID